MLKRRFGNKLVFIILTILIFLLVVEPVRAESVREEKKVEEKKEEKIQQPKYIKQVVWLILEGLNDESELPPAILNIGKQGIQREMYINPNKNLQENITSILQGRDFIHFEEGSPLLIDFYDDKKKITSFMGQEINGDEFRAIDLHKESGTSTLKEMYSNSHAFLHLFKINQDQDRGRINKEFANLIGHIYNQGLYDYTLFIIHGLPKEKDKKAEVPLILSGPNVIGAAKLPLVHMSDLVPTIYYLTDGKERPEFTGLVQWDLLKTTTRYGDVSFLKKRIEGLSKRQGELYRTLFLWDVEQKEVQKDKANILKDKAILTDTIAQKDAEIKQLKLRQKGILAGFSILCLVLLIGYGIQYRLLKKRFLLF